jgi:hypothetical protein
MKHVCFALLSSLVLVTSTAFASEDCGSTLNEVKAISQVKFPNLGTSYLNRFEGQWIEAGGKVVTITANKKFTYQGSVVLVCPTGSRSSLTASVGGHTVQITRKGQQVMIATPLGTYVFDREGSQTAGR